MKIKAAVVKEVGAPFEIKDDVELHDVGPTDLQIHMVASGICHSDEAIRRGDASLGYPVILGHEGAGIVEKVGSEVKNFKPGDHVILSFYSDGTCDNCLKGVPTQCHSYAKYNLSGVRADGDDHFTENGKHVSDMFNQSSFTTTTVVDQRNAVKVDSKLDLRKLGPLGCGTRQGQFVENLGLRTHVYARDVARRSFQVHHLYAWRRRSGRNVAKGRLHQHPRYGSPKRRTRCNG